MVRNPSLKVHYDELSGTATMAVDGCIMRVPGFFDSRVDATVAAKRLYYAITRGEIAPQPAAARRNGATDDSLQVVTSSQALH